VIEDATLILPRLFVQLLLGSSWLILAVWNIGFCRHVHFFRDCAKVPQMPFSSLDSSHPEDLWKWMNVRCRAGFEPPAISHNGHLSDGWMYPADVDSYSRSHLSR
jgi:hypothetical protein